MKRFIPVFAVVMLVNISALAASCKNYSTCKQAVIAWCAGQHPRADGDNDGIPCENVCSSKEQVDKIKAEIGCER